MRVRGRALQRLDAYHPPDAAEAANDHVIAHRVNGPLHTSPLENLLDLALDHLLCDQCHRVRHHGEAENDEHHSDNLAGGAEWV
jgi:hypothetical protein